MLKNLLFIYQIQQKKIKKKIIIFQIIAILATLAETLSLMILIPTTMIFVKIDLLKKNQFFSNFSYFKNFTDKDLTIYFSLAAFFILTVSLFLALYMHFYNYKISSKLGFEFSRKLFDIYLKKNTLFFANHSSIEINKNINFEVSRLVDKVIQPVFRMIAKSFLIISMIFVMLVYNTKITLLSSFAIVVYYFIFNIFIKKKFFQINKITTENATMINRVCIEFFNFIKEIKILDKEIFFYNKFSNISKQFYKNLSKFSFLGTIPRIILEHMFLLAVILILFVAYLTGQNNEIFFINTIFFLMVSIKIIPAFQHLYYEYASIKSAQSSIEIFIKVYKDQEDSNSVANSAASRARENPSFEKSIKFSEICYSYSSGNRIFSKINLKFFKNQTHAILGKTGSGKSTLADILCGFLTVDSGKFFIDDAVINQNNLISLQKKISLVKQNCYFLDDSFLKNIVFDESSYDINKVIRSIEFACLQDLVSENNGNYNFSIGENGSLLSGGEKQRLALARAYYHLKEILILDECTSALDIKTEKKLIQNILNLKNQTIIVITHNIEIAKQMNHLIKIDGSNFTDE